MRTSLTFARPSLAEVLARTTIQILKGNLHTAHRVGGPQASGGADRRIPREKPAISATRQRVIKPRRLSARIRVMGLPSAAEQRGIMKRSCFASLFILASLPVFTFASAAFGQAPPPPPPGGEPAPPGGPAPAPAPAPGAPAPAPAP